MDLAANLLEFQHKLRHAEDRVALRYIVVNDLRSVIDFTNAFMATGYNQNHFKIMGATNTSQIDRGAPLIQILDSIVRHKYLITPSQPIETGSVSEWGDDIAKELSLPPFYAILPLHQPGDKGRPEGCVLLFRFRAFSSSELELLTHLSGTIIHAIAALRGRDYKYSVPTYRKVKNIGWGIVFFLFLASFIPVNLSVIAPLKLQADSPQIITAPFNAVVKEIIIKPDEQVSKGQLLGTFDKRTFDQEVNLKQADLNQAQSRYAQMSKKGFVDPDARQDLELIKTDVAIAEERLNLAQLNLSLTDIIADKNATVVLSDPYSWAGRPVQAGEQIMQLVSTDDLLVEVFIESNNMIGIEADIPLKIYMDAYPLEPLEADILYVDFEPTIDDTGSLSYRVIAKLTPNKLNLRIGLKGTARVYGNKSPFIYQILRRPLVAWRQLFG
jgi:hypothetical protein